MRPRTILLNVLTLLRSSQNCSSRSRELFREGKLAITYSLWDNTCYKITILQERKLTSSL